MFDSAKTASGARLEWRSDAKRRRNVNKLRFIFKAYLQILREIAGRVEGGSYSDVRTRFCVACLRHKCGHFVFKFMSRKL